MVQNAKMKNIGKMLLSWAAVIVLVVAVVIFTIVKGTAFFSVANLLNILRAMSVVRFLLLLQQYLWLRTDLICQPERWEHLVLMCLPRHFCGLVFHSGLRL